MVPIVMLWLLGAAGATVPVELPPEQAPAAWAELLRATDMAPGSAEGFPAVRLEAGVTTWTLLVRDSTGAEHRVSVPPPTDDAAREDLVWLATSLLHPLTPPDALAAAEPNAGEELTSPRTSSHTDPEPPTPSPEPSSAALPAPSPEPPSTAPPAPSTAPPAPSPEPPAPSPEPPAPTPEPNGPTARLVFTPSPATPAPTTMPATPRRVRSPAPTATSNVGEGSIPSRTAPLPDPPAESNVGEEFTSSRPQPSLDPTANSTVGEEFTSSRPQPSLDPTANSTVGEEFTSSRPPQAPETTAPHTEPEPEPPRRPTTPFLTAQLGAAGRPTIAPTLAAGATLGLQSPRGWRVAATAQLGPSSTTLVANQRIAVSTWELALGLHTPRLLALGPHLGIHGGASQRAFETEGETLQQGWVPLAGLTLTQPVALGAGWSLEPRATASRDLRITTYELPDGTQQDHPTWALQGALGLSWTASSHKE